MRHQRWVLATGLLASSLFASAPHDRDGLTALHRAAGAGDTEQVLKLLRAGADVSTLDSIMGISPLHKAVYSGNAATVRALLTYGAHVNLQSPSNGNTALHDAIYFRRGKDKSVIEGLLALNPSLAIRNRAGLTPLESARVLKHDDIVALLEKYESTRQSKESRELMAAVHRQDVAAVASILKTVLHPNVLKETDEQGFSPLLWAAREGYGDIVALLLKAGADPNQTDQWMIANAGHKAAFWGHAAVMRQLTAHGLAVNARGGYNGYTALHDAVAGNHEETVKVLLAANADVSIRGHDGKRAVDIARGNGNATLISLLERASPPRSAR